MYEFLKIKIFLFVIAFLGAFNVLAQSSLPPCQGAYSSDWNNCFGTYTYPSGSKYVGEWMGGKRSGQGTYYFAEYKWRGDRYVGEWRDDAINGYGTYTWANGNQYVGQWKGAKRNGQGTFSIAGDGPKQSGAWINDQFQGVIRIHSEPTPDLSNYSSSNAAVPAKQSSPRLVTAGNDSEQRKKCLRMGLAQGSEDFRLCLRP